MANRRGRWRIGDVVEINLGKGTHSYAWVFKFPLVSFFGKRTKGHLQVEDVVRQPILFTLWVMKYALTSGRWRVVGNVPPGKGLRKPQFFKQDSISGKLSIYGDDGDAPATKKQCAGLEQAAVWEPQHVEDRLRDHYAGKPNLWVESLRIKDR
jgi:hypothetical protein